MRLWLNSVRYAMNGMMFAYRNERNMKIHICLATLAVVLMIVLEVSGIEAMFVTLALLLVLVSELLNTALEKTLDLIKPERHPLAKAAKDCAAAAVLLCALFAVFVGFTVFGPHLWEGPTWRWNSMN